MSEVQGFAGIALVQLTFPSLSIDRVPSQHAFHQQKSFFQNLTVACFSMTFSISTWRIRQKARTSRGVSAWTPSRGARYS